MAFSKIQSMMAANSPKPQVTRWTDMVTPKAVSHRLQTPLVFIGGSMSWWREALPFLFPSNRSFCSFLSSHISLPSTPTFTFLFSIITRVRKTFTVRKKLHSPSVNLPQVRAVRRRIGGRRRRWVVLWPAAEARRAFFIGGGGGVALWSASAASAVSDRMTEHWNSALAGQAFFSGFTGVSHFTPDLRWAAGAERLTVNMHAMHNFTVLMSCSLPNF